MNKNSNEIIEAAKWVVDAFDQADTGSQIRVYGGFSTDSRRQILIEAVDDLREILRKSRRPSSLPYVRNGRPEYYK